MSCNCLACFFPGLAVSADPARGDHCTATGWKQQPESWHRPAHKCHQCGPVLGPLGGTMMGLTPSPESPDSFSGTAIWQWNKTYNCYGVRQTLTSLLGSVLCLLRLVQAGFLSDTRHCPLVMSKSASCMTVTDSRSRPLLCGKVGWIEGRLGIVVSLDDAVVSLDVW